MDINEFVSLYDEGDRSMEYDNDTFVKICSFGRLDIAQWLYSTGNIDIHTDDEKPFRLSCCCGRKDIAQWLYELNEDINTSVWNHEAFRCACYFKRIDVVQWLCTISEMYEVIIEDDEILGYQILE